jgi:hypothetical protein
MPAVNTWHGSTQPSLCAELLQHSEKQHSTIHQFPIIMKIKVTVGFDTDNQILTRVRNDAP